MVNHSDIIWSVVDGEAVLLNIASGHYYSLNETATDIWQRLQQGASEAQVVEAIAQTYRIDPETVQRDVTELIQELRATKLVE